MSVFLNNVLALIFTKSEHFFTLKMEAAVTFETFATSKKTVKDKEV
jgi:hypothetical protein